jgi:SAM-dependent methyltransferase
VGIDLSQVQVDQGRTRAQALGLNNLELLAGDIARMNLAALGQFDFIVAHGVYSWVPAAVQEALLSAFRRLLAPEGVAYMSYNVYPGWKSKEILRDAMLLASGDSATPEEKVREARRMVDFLEEVSSADDVLSSVLAVSKAHAIGFGDSYLLHDELETFNEPCYFYEMLGRAGAHGLTYLAEAHPETMLPANFGPKVAEYLGDSVAVSKCWWSSTWISSSAACSGNRYWFYAERAPLIRYNPDRSRYRRLHIAAWVPPVDGQTRLDHAPGVPGTRRCDAVHKRSGNQGSTGCAQRPLALDPIATRAGGCGACASCLRGFQSQRRPRRPHRRPDGGPDHAGSGASPA